MTSLIHGGITFLKVEQTCLLSYNDGFVLDWRVKLMHEWVTSWKDLIITIYSTYGFSLHSNTGIRKEDLQYTEKHSANRTTKRLHNATHELEHALAANLRLGSLFAEFVLVWELSGFFAYCVFYSLIVDLTYRCVTPLQSGLETHGFVHLSCNLRPLVGGYYAPWQPLGALQLDGLWNCPISSR